MQLQTVGKNVILIFNEGLRELLKLELERLNYRLYFFCKVAKICPRDLFEKSYSFNGLLTGGFKDIAPTVNWLLLMILYGTNLEQNKCDTLPRNTVIQLLIHNCKKYANK